MLVLSRKLNESIVISELGVTITVVEIRGDKVRLGIEAPREVPIYRSEVAEAMGRNPNAVQPGTGAENDQTAGGAHAG